MKPGLFITIARTSPSNACSDLANRSIRDCLAGMQYKVLITANSAHLEGLKLHGTAQRRAATLSSVRYDHRNGRCNIANDKMKKRRRYPHNWPSRRVTTCVALFIQHHSSTTRPRLVTPSGCRMPGNKASSGCRSMVGHQLPKLMVYLQGKPTVTCGAPNRPLAFIGRGTGAAPHRLGCSLSNARAVCAN